MKMNRRHFFSILGGLAAALFVPHAASKTGKSPVIFLHPRSAMSYYLDAYLNDKPVFASTMKYGDLCALDDELGLYRPLAKECLNDGYLRAPGRHIAVFCWDDERKTAKLMSWPDLKNEVYFTNYVEGKSFLVRQNQRLAGG